MLTRIKVILIAWPILAFVLFICLQTVEPIRSVALKWLFWMSVVFLPLVIYAFRKDHERARPGKRKKKKMTLGAWKTQAFFIAWPGIVLALYAVLQIKEPFLMPILKWLVWMYAMIIPLAIYTLRGYSMAITAPRAEEMPGASRKASRFEGLDGFKRRDRSMHRSKMPYVERVD